MSDLERMTENTTDGCLSNVHKQNHNRQYSIFLPMSLVLLALAGVATGYADLPPPDTAHSGVDEYHSGIVARQVHSRSEVRQVAATHVRQRARRQEGNNGKPGDGENIDCKRVRRWFKDIPTLLLGGTGVSFRERRGQLTQDQKDECLASGGCHGFFAPNMKVPHVLIGCSLARDTETDSLPTARLSATFLNVILLV
jgi:hypothetical protein